MEERLLCSEVIAVTVGEVIPTGYLRPAAILASKLQSGKLGESS